MTRLEHMAREWTEDTNEHHIKAYVAGFRAARSMVLEELEAIVGQTENPQDIALLSHFQKLGERET